jgi:hypothetical protein
MCSGMVSSSCSTSGTRCVSLVKTLVASHETGKDGSVITTKWTNPQPFVIQIFRNDQPKNGYDGKTFEAITSI